MKSNLSYTAIAIALITALVTQPLASLAFLFTNGRPFVASAQAQAAPRADDQAPAAHALYLPLIATKGGPPTIEISTPAAGATVAGTVIVAARTTDGQSLTSVTFQAGSTLLATDNTPADGFRAYLNARQFPAGALTLTATARTAGGEGSQSLTVTVLPDPPSSGALNSDGSGIFDSQIGSVIMLRPGSAPAGAQINVTELSQEQVTAQHQINWDAIGVTFLGAQQVESSVPLVEPFAGVSSAGFGNRVQPGQAVVNYRLAPDADGDGVSEIVVVNTASVAPGGDVVADVIAPINLGSLRKITSNPSAAATTNNGPPGTTFSVEVTGLNATSATGNRITWKSLVNGKVLETPGIVYGLQGDPSRQNLVVTIPVLPPGSAIFSVTNQSTGYSSTPITVTVTTPGALSNPALTIVNQFWDDMIQYLQAYPTATPEQANKVTQLISKISLTKQSLNQMAAQPPLAEFNQLLTDMALIIQNSPAYESVNGASQSVPAIFNPNVSAAAALGALMALGTTLRAAGTLILPFNPVLGAGLNVAGTVMQFSAGIFAVPFGFCMAVTGGNCIPLPRPSCTPAQSPAGPTGMGSAPPPGGNGCGGTNGSGGGQIFQAANGMGLQSLAGQIAVKIYLNNKPTPFTGLSDAGGYFFVPFIPEGEPFTAVAYDSVSKQTRTFAGTGPKTGDSVYLYFDFATGEDATNIRWDGGGDGASWNDARNWAGDSVPIDLSRVVIDNAPGRTIVITDVVEISSLQSAAPLALHKGSQLILSGSSSLTNGLTLQSNTRLIANGAGVKLTVTGASITLPANAALIANGAGAAITLGATPLSITPGGALEAIGVGAAITATGPLTLYGAGLFAGDGGQLLLPQATTYNGNIRSLGIDRYYPNFDLQERCSSSVIGGVVNICAVGSGSRINLSGLTSVIGETWTGFFGAVAYLSLRANDSGQIDLHNLQTISEGRIAALARGSGSLLNLAQLQNTGDRSYFLSVEQGALDIRNLTNLTLATLDIGHLPAVQTSQITNLSNAIVYVDQNTPDFTNLTNINGSSLYATGGGQILLPQVVEYAGDGRDFFTTIEANGIGSLIAFPALTSLVGNTFVNDALLLNAKAGGQIKLPKLPLITSGKVQMTAEQSGSLIDLPLLNTFLRDGRGESWLKALDGGKIATPLLTTLNGISLYFAPNGTLDSAQITDFTNGLVDVTGVTPNLNGMTHVSASSFMAHNGGKISVPQVTSYTAIGDEFFPTLRAEGAGSLVDFSTVTSYTGQTGSGNAYIEAKDGGTVRLNQVAAINTGQVHILADGVNARVDLTSLAHLSSGVDGWRDALKLLNGGVIDRGSNALTVEITDIELDKTSQLLVGPLQLMRASQLLGNGALSGSVLLQDSTLTPGSNSAGKMTAATYTQAGASTLAVEIGGTQAGLTYDQVAISGNAVLTGTLEISLINGYLPPLNSSFAILTASAVSGTFTTVTGTEIGNGRQFNVLYSNSGVTLQVVAAP